MALPASFPTPPTLKTTNRAPELAAEAERLAADIVRDNPAVAGILLGGGVARGFADQFSDVDLEIFVHQTDRAAKAAGVGIADHFLPQGNFVELSLHSIKEWMDPRNEARIWTMANRWDKSTARILHDPDGRIARMLKIKLVFRRDERKRLQAEARDDSLWMAKGVADAWVQRGSLAAAHHAVNCGCDLLLDYLFLKNDRFIAHAKWKLFYALQLQTLPERFEQRIQETLLVKDLSAADLARRQAVFVPLARESHRLPNTRA